MAIAPRYACFHAYNSVSRADMDAQNIILVYSKGKAPATTWEKDMRFINSSCIENSLVSAHNCSSPQRAQVVVAEVVSMCRNQVMRV